MKLISDIIKKEEVDFTIHEPFLNRLQKVSCIG